MLLAACGGSTGGNPNSFIPPVTRIDEDGVTIISADGRIDSEAAVVQGGSVSADISAALTEAGVKQAEEADVNAFTKGSGQGGVYVLSDVVVARITSDYIDEFSRLVYGEGAAQDITRSNKYAGPGDTGHADFGTFILSNADSDNYNRDFGGGAHLLSYQLAPSAVYVDLSKDGSAHSGMTAPDRQLVSQ